MTRFESCRNDQVSALIQLGALTHLMNELVNTRKKTMDRIIYLSTVGVLGVDQTFGFLEESSIDKVGPRQFGQRIDGEADDFRLEDAVLVQRDDDLVGIADNQMQLRINVECFCYNRDGKSVSYVYRGLRPT